MTAYLADTNVLLRWVVPEDPLCPLRRNAVRQWASRENCCKRSGVAKHDDLLARILQGTSDANLPFNDLRQLLRRLGFEERIRGSHHTFRKAGVEEKINLQRDDSKAKIYQVRQVRAIILKYKLGGPK